MHEIAKGICARSTTRVGKNKETLIGSCALSAPHLHSKSYRNFRDVVGKSNIYSYTVGFTFQTFEIAVSLPHLPYTLTMTTSEVVVSRLVFTTTVIVDIRLTAPADFQWDQHAVISLP